MDIAIPMKRDNYYEKSFGMLLKEELKDSKLEMFKRILKEKNIKFDEKITDFNKLKKLVYKNLSKDEISEIEQEMKNTSDEISEILDLMKDATDTKIQKVLDKIKSNVISPVAMATLFTITTKVMYTALITLPTPVRTITGVIGLSGMVYKGSKAVMNAKRRQISKRYDRVLSKLETTYDAEGNIIDSRFNKEEQEKILKYLERINITVKSNNYEDIMEAVKSLKNKNKLEIIKILNDAKGQPIDIDKELNMERKKEKYGFLKEIIAGIGIGVGVATAANAIDETLISGILNGFLLKNFGTDSIKKMIKNSVLGNFISDEMIDIAAVALGGIATKASTFIPIIGEEIKNAFAAESLIAGGVAGGTIALAKASVKGIYKAIKRANKKLKEDSEEKKKQDFDKKKYPSNKEIVFSDKQMLMLEMIERFMKEQNMKFDISEIKTSEDLKNAIQALSDEDKKELNANIRKMQNILNRLNLDNKEVAKEVFKFISSAFMTAATIMTVNDIMNYISDKVSIGENTDDTKEIEETNKTHRKADEFLKDDQETPEIENYEAEKQEINNIKGDDTKEIKMHRKANEFLKDNQETPEIEAEIY